MAADYLASTEPLLEQIETDVLAVWPDTEKVVFGRELLPDEKNRVSVRLGVASVSSLTVLSVEVAYSVTVRARFGWPAAGENLEIVKKNRMNDLVEQMMTGPTYAGCHLPQITHFDFDPAGEDARDETYELEIGLRCAAEATHH
jgi:hypothetical protein